METVALVLGSVLAVVLVAFAARPFLREPAAADADDRLDALDEAGRLRLEAAERRDRALAALKELEFDHRTRKISDDDYRALLGPLRHEAAAALQELDRLEGGSSAGRGGPTADEND